MLTYRITPIDVHGHSFQVSITIPKPDPNGQRLTLPNWIPGSYMIRDFARNIIGLHAESKGYPVTIKTIDKSTWQLGAARGAVTVHYQVYAWDLSVRAAYLDQNFGFFNNTSLCLAVENQTDSRCRLELISTEATAHWRVATGMPRRTGETFDYGEFEADSYEALIDYPFLLGELSIEEFIAKGIKHRLVLAGRHYADMSRITADLARVCEAQLQQFGKPAPFQDYTFLTIVIGKGFGGLEHRNSTALLCGRHDLARVGATKIDNDYRTFLSLCSHEYFHSWNVKTLKPKQFIPYKLKQESYTEQLWFYEGVTSYFDDYVLHQAELISAEEYLELLGATLSRVYRGAGVTQQTVTESSFLTWTKFYKQDENAPNAIVSYYQKGALIALGLDLLLRLQTKHKVTLAIAMRDLWHSYGKNITGTEKHTVWNHLNQYDGVNVDEFLQRALYTTDPLNLEALLSEFGVSLKRECYTDDNAAGGKSTIEQLPVQLGAKYKATSQGIEITHVYHDETAHFAGLSAGDRIIAIDHLQANDATIKSLLARMKPDSVTTIHAFRRDELMVLECRWKAPEPANRVLKITAPEKLNGWLTPSQ